MVMLRVMADYEFLYLLVCNWFRYRCRHVFACIVRSVGVVVVMAVLHSDALHLCLGS